MPDDDYEHTTEPVVTTDPAPLDDATEPVASYDLAASTAPSASLDQEAQHEGEVVEALAEALSHEEPVSAEEPEADDEPVEPTPELVEEPAPELVEPAPELVEPTPEPVEEPTPEPVEESLPEPVDQPATDDPAQPDAVAEAQPVQEAPAAAPRRRRRAASRPAGPPSVPVTPPAAVEPTAPAPVDEVVYPDGAVVTRALTSPTEAPAGGEVPASAPESGRPSRRRRSAGRRQGPPETPPAETPGEAPEPPVEEEDTSTRIAEAVARQGRSSRGRRRTVAPEEREQALNDLVAALAGDTGVAEQRESEDVSEEETSLTVSVEETSVDLEAEEVESDDSDASDEDESEPGGRRRRRRRGGRRRRRGSEAGESDSGDEAENSEEPGAEADEAAAEGDEDADLTSGEAGDGTRRRRRRRRRRGEDTGGGEDEPADVVVRVREPRAPRVADEITGIEGSTRMEAKRQRRKDGRAAGRARRPILSEAEFLSRREAVNRRLLIRQRDDYTQLAVLEDNVLVEHYVDRESATSLIGNVYLGRVQNVLPSMEAVFIDIGRGRNAVLYAGEVAWENYGAEGEPKKVEHVFKSGQTVLVQVTKDPVGAKGARLTNHVSIPGRYVVYSPGGHLSGISRKLADTERHRLRDILGDLVGDDASVIVRTAAEGASEDELVRDVSRLKAQWEAIEKKAKQGSAPQLLYAEPDLTVRIVRDLFTEDFGELVISGNGGAADAFDTIEAYVTHVAPHLHERVKRWDSDADGDLFAKHRIDEQIAKALERKVFLPSGGSLVIDRTEAMTVIDVNTGKFTGSGGNLEATVTSNNLEAAEEIVRQLRLRDIGGIIVVDFIDMVLPSNRELLLRRLVECLGRDRTRHQVAEVTSLGLVQMTRKRIGTGLAEAFTEQCDCCGGRGYVRHEEPVESQAPSDGGERKVGRRGGRRRSPGSSGSDAS
ncbi:MAG TPA: Rne/Rng family ribonuclease [Propionibacteriaceae bacterium]|nr:Rne/Rng family ribonuclease [Propionibacteriaceae bacterium]